MTTPTTQARSKVIATMKVFLALLTASTVSSFAPTSTSKQITALNNVGSKWAYDPYGATYQETAAYHPVGATNQENALNNVGSKWAYDPYGATYQENFFYHRDPTSDPWTDDMWYFQPWSFVDQPQFFPLERVGIDMWYFEPRTVIPADDEFFHGYNSASHVWIPSEASAPAQAAAAPVSAPVPVLEASEQGSIPPVVPQQQMMPESVQQKMPEMDSTMAAYDRAMAGN